MNRDTREEIAASVAAGTELGPAYESAVAEGLIERIGEEIDKRVDARLRGTGPAGSPSVAPPMPATAAAPPAIPHLTPQQTALGHLPPLQMAAPPAGQGPMPQAAAQLPARRSTGASITSMVLALGSMGLGVGATAVIASNVGSAPAQVVTILFVWIAIAMINAAHARFYWADGGPQRRHQHHR